MTICKTILSIPFKHRSIVVMLSLAGVVGCSSLSTVLEPDRVDYKSAGKVTAPKLDIPPDLTQLQRENRYAVPEASPGIATASGYNLVQKRPVSDDTRVAPSTMANMHIERDGSQRWLVVNASPETLWPKIKEFWQDSGFTLNAENKETGVMETDWAENRAKIPQDFVRNTLGKVFNSLYATGERDKFRTRLERGAGGNTEIYISHRGAEEVLTGAQKESSIWTARPTDPQLEAEFLSRLMARLGADQTQAKAAVVDAPPLQARSRLIGDAATGAYVQVDEGFDRAWRRIGLALDRVGFTVEDRDRSQGLYFVRYVDQDAEAKEKNENQGFFARLFHSKRDKTKNAASYRIFIKANEAGSQVSVLNKEGQLERSNTSNSILRLLNEQLQ